jgi:hypothetical protein
MKKLSTSALFLAALLLSSSLLLSCGSNPSDTPQDTSKGTATAVGTPIGSPATASIDANGGTLISPDGRLEVIVPENALATATTLSIQPITNESPLGAGGGFSLLPHGQQFAKPVTVRMHYSQSDLTGTSPKALLIATQKADHIWYALGNLVLDESAGTLSASTTHFSDYNLAQYLRLSPPAATIAVNRSQSLKLTMLKPAEDDDPDDDLSPLGYVAAPVLGQVDWSINGDLAGNQSDGSVSPKSGSATTTYTAPSTIANMSSNPVAVTATVQDPTLPGKFMVSANITVTEGSGVSGRITLTLSLNDSRTRTLGGVTEVKSEAGSANLVYMLPNIALMASGGSRDANWDDAAFNGTSSQTSDHSQTYEVICSGGSRMITNRDKTVTNYEGGAQRTGAGLMIMDDGSYTVLIGPSGSLDAAASTYTTWTNSCDLPEQVNTMPGRGPVPFAPYFIPYIGGGAMKTTGKIDPAHPNEIKGVYHGTDQLPMFSAGTETITMPVEYTITWDLTIVQ